MKKTLSVIGAVLAVLALSAGIALAADEYEEAGATQAIGGLLNTSDGRLEYRVPADAYWFSDETRMRYFKPGPSNLPPLPEGTASIGDPFRLELREWPQLTMLSWRKPVTITIHYSLDELGGRSESWLRIVRCFDGWVELPITVDTVSHTVTTQVPWGGEYALIAYNSEPPTPAPAAASSVTTPALAYYSSQPPAGSTIAGRIFFDKNGNGVMDGEDYPVTNAALRLGNDSYNALASTGADGYYTFSNVPVGTYSVDPVVGAEWDFTTPNSVGGVSVTGQPGSSRVADFGVTYRSWYTP